MINVVGIAVGVWSGGDILPVVSSPIELHNFSGRRKVEKKMHFCFNFPPFAPISRAGLQGVSLRPLVNRSDAKSTFGARMFIFARGFLPNQGEDELADCGVDCVLGSSGNELELENVLSFVLA